MTRSIFKKSVSKRNSFLAKGDSRGAVLIKPETRDSVQRLLREQVPENTPTFKKLGNHVLVGMRVAVR